MKRTVIKRNTNYIEFYAGIETNMNKTGDLLKVFKNEWGWHTNQNGKFYHIPDATLKTLLETRLNDYVLQLEAALF